MARNDWNLEQARAAYNIAHWSSGYFDVDERGHLIARPKADTAGGVIDLHELTERIRAHGLSTPVLVRFIDVLHHRIDVLHGAFTAAMAKLDYRGAYSPVYPI